MLLKELENEEWVEPETVRQLLGEDTPSIEVLKQITYKVIKSTEAPFVDFYVFEDVVHILNDIEPNVEAVEGSLPEHIWYALKLIDQLRPDAVYSHEVKEYITFIYRDAGILFLPPWLGDNDIYDKVLNYVNNTKIIDTEDGDNLMANQAVHYLRIQTYINSKTT